MVSERRCRIAPAFHVTLTPCKSGRLIEVGKKVCWLSCGRACFCIGSCQDPLEITMDHERAVPQRSWTSSQLFCFFVFLECLKRFASFCSGTRNVSRILHFAEVMLLAFFRIRCTAEIADLPNSHYLSMFVLVCFARLLNGKLTNLCFRWTFPQ